VTEGSGVAGTASAVEDQSAMGRGRHGSGMMMFILLMLALLPLGLIAVAGAIQTIRSTELEHEASFRLATAQAAGRLSQAIERDRAVLRLVANDAEKSRSPASACRIAARGVNSEARSMALAFAGTGGRLLCTTATGDGALHALVADGVASLDETRLILPGRAGLVARATSINGTVVAGAHYGYGELAAMAALSTDPAIRIRARITRGGQSVLLAGVDGLSAPGRLIRASAPLGPGAMTLDIESERPPFSGFRLAAALLPVFMWIASALVGWWVINRFMLAPLIALNRQVSAYEPGMRLDPVVPEGRFVREIGMLADSFREISEDVREHEAQLATALAQQRALTREVHHRVKNNLQIVASLINLHSRAAATPDAMAAYASIQRRVDALAVVHRNHYAASETVLGIDAGVLFSELASAARSGGQGQGREVQIRVSCDPLFLSQDTAVPAAFLVMELFDIVLQSGVPADATVQFCRTDNPAVGRLSVMSDALRPSPVVDSLLAGRFDRILSGLSRQLRATLDRDPATGLYAIDIPLY